MVGCYEVRDQQGTLQARGGASFALVWRGPSSAFTIIGAYLGLMLQQCALQLKLADLQQALMSLGFG